MVRKLFFCWPTPTLGLTLGGLMIGLLAAGNLWAQSAPLTLKQAFDEAWARQPEAQSLTVRREAAEARRQSADSWMAEPLVLGLSTQTDQINNDQGRREYAAEIAWPMWLPGERTRMATLADAETRATVSRALAAQLRMAATVREAWWDWQRARIEQGLAQDRLNNAQRLAADVTRRVKAGDLARADQHQAAGAAAGAELAKAEAEAALATATQHLRALTGKRPDLPSTNGAEIPVVGEPVPTLPADLSALDTTHPAVAELLDRAEVAQREAELAEVQTRANPELMLATTRDRERMGDPYRQTVSIGLRFPLGSDSRHRAKVGLARAEAIEATGQWQLERERLIADLEAARIRVESARTQQTAAEKRAQLARESRGFFEKSFRLGESDLPTRLRIELEAVDAERQAARSHIDLAAAVSRLRQALGLLPE